ncbi:MAG: hypothetical protein ABW081_13015 [Solirubrobacteraceae bacterium]
MRARLLAPTLAAVLLIPAARASAGDPVMPLGDVRAGMQCTGLSVVRGTAISSFDVEVIDVVDAAATGSGSRIMVRASGPAVDATGIGPGFSGSPIYCPAAGGPRVIGAISESIGEYGGKVVLATPIQAMLGVPVDPPKARATRASRRLAARARPLAVPLTVSGLSPRLGRALQEAAAKRGRVVLAAPQAGPLGSFPVQTLRPGSALGVGYADGDINASAIGTVSYVDGDRIWGFGHPLDAVGPRSLLLQDAYIFRVINNPDATFNSFGSYKYGAAGHALGTLTSDGLSAVAGRVGALPETVPVKITAKDLDAGTELAVESRVADEAAVDQPTGGSLLSLIAPLAVTQAAGTVLDGSPARLTGRACFSIGLRELRSPLRFCNRYVSDFLDLLGAGNVIAEAASTDLGDALARIDGYKAGEVHVTRVDGTVEISRGQRQAFLRKVTLPRTIRKGTRKVQATVVLRHVRGASETRRMTVKLPRLRPGVRKVVFVGKDVDFSEGDLFEIFGFDFGSSGGSLGPANLRALARSVEGIRRWDGVNARPPRRGPNDFAAGVRSFRDADLRISGRVRTTVRVKRR